MDHSSRNCLNFRHLDRFPGDTLFDRIARSVCNAGCLPRKELYEAWEVARRVRRRFRGGRVVDMACGHGLLSRIMLLLDDSSPEALAVDLQIPASAGRLTAALNETWPRLEGRVRFDCMDLEQVVLTEGDLVVSVHACGALTDRVLDRALAARARVAVLPCCHNLDNGDMGGLEGWLDGPLAMDVARAARLRSHGYRVYTQTIPAGITPKNRLLLAEPL
ncbi:MAG: class I SAM-dependent methyltransferase [Geobacteraceae bacterium]|nr:class I SAM-dependent methyltransferase [Geobacteraceae bacterium]